MRTSEWITPLNLKVRPCEQRPDAPGGDVVYRVKDIFTTRDGSWEPSSALGALPQWARESYLRPWGVPDYFDDAGGDHHLFARVLDQQGNPLKSEGLVRYWSDGFAKLGDPTYQGYVRMTPKAGSGWANQVIFSSYVPERGESGPWCWCPEGAADVVVGGGLPANNHISTFVVWQAEPRMTGGSHTQPDGGTGSPTAAPADFDLIRRVVWGNAGITFNNSSSFADYARRHNLGAPITNESDIGGYRAQGYANGIVFAPINQWDKISHLSW
jgi:hypothetical protein